MGVSVTRNFGNLADLQLSNKALMREIGLLARERIKRRTIGGRDEHDLLFKPYSHAYQQAKAKAIGGAGRVNLQVSGDMLNAIQIVDVTDTSVTLTFDR